MEDKKYISSVVTDLIKIVLIGLFFGVLVALVAHLFVEGVKFFSLSRDLFTKIEIGGFLFGYGHVITLTVAALLIAFIKQTLSIGRWEGPGDSIFAAHRTDNELNVQTGLASTLVAFISASGGASVGQYGPLVHFGAVVGSFCKRVLSTNITTDVVIGCGVAAAISAGFNAPIAGVIFAHEAILRHFSLRAIAPIAIASCVAAGVTQLIFPGGSLFEVDNFNGDLSRLLIIALLTGPIFGCVAIGLMQSVRLTTKFSAIQKLSLSKSLLLAVAITSLGGVFVPQALGLGGGTIKSVLDGQYTFDILISIFLMKIVLTTACLGFGLFGGIFSPSLVIGASAGGIVYYLLTSIGIPFEDPIALIICGMAAVSSAVIGAPIAGTMIVLELTGSYEYALLAMICIVTSVLLSGSLYGHSFFDRQLIDRGIDIAAGRTGIELMDRSITSIYHDDYTEISLNCTVSETLEKLVEQNTTEGYVEDSEGIFLGKVAIQEIVNSNPKEKIKDYVQTDYVSIKSDASLQQAMEVAVDFVGESIPVIDRETNKLLGVVAEADLFRDYLQIQNKIVDLERS